MCLVPYVLSWLSNLGALGAFLSHVPLLVRALVIHPPRALRALVLYVFFALLALQSTRCLRHKK